MAGDQLLLDFQPKASLRTNRVVGMEALVRWAHPPLGRLHPGAFVPVAERGPEIAELGGWVLRQACRHAARWQRAAGLSEPPFFVSVNVSPRQFTPELVDTVADALRSARCPPAALVLEITESTVMADPVQTREILQDLGELGVRAAIDDFGTGYSSLAYLRRFPLHAIKIDRAFVDGLGVEAEDSAIVAASISMAHALGRAVLAEGVETNVQLERLRSLGCDMAQGFYFGPPVPAEEADRVVPAVTLGEWRPDRFDEGDEWQPASLSPTVLVVDDAEDVRMLVRTALATGFSVHETVSGGEALVAVNQLNPDCVVVDLNVPGRSGLDVLRRLRQDVGPDLPIVALTGSAGFAARAEAYALGADDYVVKPVAARELVARVSRVLLSRASASLGTDARDSPPLEAADDGVLVVLARLLAGWEQANQGMAHAVTRASVVLARRRAGVPWRELFVRGDGSSAIMELNATTQALVRANSSFRRIVADALYHDGVAMEQIGALLGVSPQRVSKVLRGAGDD